MFLFFNLQYKAKNVIKSGLYDIATVSWLKRVTEKQNWAKLKTWYPWELLSSRPSTKHQISQLYDEFYDSFTEEADEDMFKRTLEKSEEAVRQFFNRMRSLHFQRKKSQIIFCDQSVRDTKKMLINKIVHLKKIYKFSLNHFLIG